LYKQPLGFLKKESGGFSFGKEVRVLPKKPKKPCAFAGCPELTDDYYCEQHRKEHAKQYNRFERDPAANKRYGTQWRKIRARFLAAYPLCELCKREGKYVPADTVHHKRKIADGGGNDWPNLQALCAPCHSRIHAEQGDGLNKK
jgi:5-methylcytosine-specific restriction protein A